MHVTLFSKTLFAERGPGQDLAWESSFADPDLEKAFLAAPTSEELLETRGPHSRPPHFLVDSAPEYFPSDSSWTCSPASQGLVRSTSELFSPVLMAQSLGVVLNQLSSAVRWSWPS